ncbi:MAG: ImmA/IrrE family metallo-endopeptidase [Bacteroidales bacterium]|nr:ImmA/IrrE family metallo-endopeptidase [Bacteroidales bacterium]
MARIPEYIIESEANELRFQFSIDVQSPVDVEALLQKKGILSVFTSMSENFSGMCLKSMGGENNFILINSNQPLGRQYFTIAHELYHVYCQKPQEFKVHSCQILKSDSPVENHANVFASYFLMPTMGVADMLNKMKCNKHNVTAAHIISLCNYFRVSYKAMLVRVNKLLNIDKKLYNSLLLVQPTAAAKEYSLNYEIFEKPKVKNMVIGDYYSKAQSLYNSNKISNGHLIELLEALKIGDGK